MKKILKITALSAVLLMLAGGFYSCQKNKNNVCNVKNPLTDLPWLKELANSMNDTKYTGGSITQCTYGDGKDGFVIVPCVKCQVYNFYLYSCDGTVLDDYLTVALENQDSDIHPTILFDIKWNIQNEKIIFEINPPLG